MNTRFARAYPALFALTMLSLPAAAKDAPPSAAPAARFNAASQPALTVQRSKVGLLLVQPTVNGVPAGWFIFDSGAGMSVVSTPHADTLGLKPAGSVDALGVAGTEKTAMFRVERFELGPLALADVPVITTDLSFLQPHLGEEIAGIVGYDLLAACVAEIDFAVPRIAIHDPARYSAPKAKWTPLRIEGRIPTVEAKLEGREGRFRLDTGSSDAVTVFEPSVRKWALLDGRQVKDAAVAGVGGSVAARRGQVSAFELGALRLTDVPAMFIVESRGSSGDAARDGRIGAGLLKDVLLVLDYPHERAWFGSHDSEDRPQPDRR